MDELPDPVSLEGFEWDQGNAQKNWRRHRVAFAECEEIFLHGPIILPNPEHSATEPRHYAFGRTAQGRLLTVVFTVRRNKVRVISARDMSRKERRFYAEETPKNP